MNVFLGAEIEGPAASKWFELQKEFSAKLSVLKDVSYGDGLTDVAIISIIMRPTFFEENGYKERKLYRKKSKAADIRLRMDYSRFLNTSKEARRDQYIEHILTALRIAGEKAGADVDLTRLLFDVENILMQESE